MAALLSSINAVHVEKSVRPRSNLYMSAPALVDPSKPFAEHIEYIAPKITIQLENRKGYIRVGKNTGVTYIRVVLQGKVATPPFTSFGTLFHSSNILECNIDSAAATDIGFSFSTPKRARFDVTPAQQAVWQQAMVDYVAYKKGTLNDTDYSVVETEEDKKYNDFVANLGDCGHVQMLPTYGCPLTASRVEYNIVVKGYTRKHIVTATAKVALYPDTPYPSADIRLGVDPFLHFNLLDTVDDRVCVKKGGIVIPVPKPLQIGKLCNVDIYGVTGKTVHIRLICCEIKRAACRAEEFTKMIVASLPLFSGKVKNNQIKLDIPTELYPSFEHCQLSLEYNLTFGVAGQSLKVPVGVNYSGKEC